MRDGLAGPAPLSLSQAEPGAPPCAAGADGEGETGLLPASGTYCAYSRRAPAFPLCIYARLVRQDNPMIHQSMISLGTRGAGGHQPV